MSSFEETILSVLREQPSTAKEVMKKVGEGTKKGEVNSVLYTLLKKGRVRKDDSAAPVWSVIPGKTKYLVIIGHQWKPEWIEDAAKCASDSLKILFFTDKKFVGIPKEVEQHFVTYRTAESCYIMVTIALTQILSKNNDIEIVFSSTNGAWKEVLLLLDEAFGMKWTIVSREWDDVRRHLE